MLKRNKKDKKIEKNEQTVNLDDYFLIPKTFNFEKPEVPKGMELWSKEHQMSDEYKKMISELNLLMIYVANMLNSGPEVKESVSKRVITARILINRLLDGIFLDSFHKAGILAELQNDLIFKSRFTVVHASDIDKIIKNRKQDKDNGGGMYV